MLQTGDPKSMEEGKCTGDAYKTLFVARLVFFFLIFIAKFKYMQAYTVSEADLKDEFEYYGPVKKVALTS